MTKIFLNFKCHISHNVCFGCVSKIYKTSEYEFKCPIWRIICELEDEDFILINNHLTEDEKIKKTNEKVTSFYLYRLFRRLLPTNTDIPLGVVFQKYRN